MPTRWLCESRHFKWRGIKLEPKYFPNLDKDEKVTENYVINYPDLNIPIHEQ